MKSIQFVEEKVQLDVNRATGHKILRFGQDIPTYTILHAHI